MMLVGAFAPLLGAKVPKGLDRLGRGQSLGAFDPERFPSGSDWHTLCVVRSMDPETGIGHGIGLKDEGHEARGEAKGYDVFHAILIAWTVPDGKKTKPGKWGSTLKIVSWRVRFRTLGVRYRTDARQARKIGLCGCALSHVRRAVSHGL